jgi:hypothetical protein
LIQVLPAGALADEQKHECGRSMDEPDERQQREDCAAHATDQALDRCEKSDADESPL